MDTRTRDERLKQIYEQNAPIVNDDNFARHVEEATKSRRPKTFGTAHPRRHVALGALAVVVVLGLIGFGVHALVERLDRDNSVLVFTDDTVSTDQVPDTFRINLGPADEIRLADAWVRIAEEAGLEAKTAQAYETNFTYTADGILKRILLLVTLDDGNVLEVTWEGEGSPDEEVDVLVERAKRPTYSPAVADNRLYYLLFAIDEVGVQQMFALMPEVGSDGLYDVAWWPPDLNVPQEQAYYLWEEPAFRELSTTERGSLPDDEHMWIPVTAVIRVDSGASTPTTASYLGTSTVNFYVPLRLDATDPQPAELLDGGKR